MVLKFNHLISSLLLTIGLPTSALAGDEDVELVIAGTDVPYVFHNQQSGLYNEIMDQIVEAYPGNVDVQMMPMRRAVGVFQKEQSDCVFIGNDSREFHADLGFPAERLIFSKPFYVNKIKVYTAISNPQISSGAELVGSVAAADLGTMQGHLVHQNAPKDMELLPVETMDRAFKLLERGRVSSVVAFSLDAEAYFSRADAQGHFHASPDYSIATTNESLVCWNNARAIEFIAHADRVLEKRASIEY
jgi:ABC-type amino acid transport substrate-binding protein